MANLTMQGVSSGYRSIMGDPYKDPKTGFWTQKVIGMEKVDPLADYEKGLQSQQKYKEIDSRYGINRVGSIDTSGSAASGIGTSSLFGNLSSYTDQAKDLARFRLGLDQEQAKFSSGLRETEFQSDFGRNYKLAEQQIGGQKDITNLQQSATTDRLQRQLESQQTMQKSGFDQQNLYRAQSAALALRGLR